MNMHLSYLEAPDGMETLVRLVWTCILSVLQSHQRVRFLKWISGLLVTKDGRTVKIVEEPEVQAALLGGCESSRDVILLATYDVLIPHSVDQYSKMSGTESLEERIRAEKVLIQDATRIAGFGSSSTTANDATRIAGFGSSSTTANLFSSKPQSINAFSTQSGSSSAAATSLFTAGSPFGAPAATEVASPISFGFAANSKLDEPIESYLTSGGSPFRLAATPTAVSSTSTVSFGVFSEPQADQSGAVSIFESFIMPAATEIDFSSVALSAASGQLAPSRRSAPKKSAVRRK
jgi:hypothetical protein